MWREGAIQALLATEDAEISFVAGCAENQAKFPPQFDQIILLRAPSETLVRRLATGLEPSATVAAEVSRRELSDASATFAEPR